MFGGLPQNASSLLALHCEELTLTAKSSPLRYMVRKAEQEIPHPEQDAGGLESCCFISSKLDPRNIFVSLILPEAGTDAPHCFLTLPFLGKGGKKHKNIYIFGQLNFRLSQRLGEHGGRRGGGRQRCPLHRGGAAVPGRAAAAGGERARLGFPQALERYFKDAEETLRGADPLMSFY